jgi:hypothetical protein
VTRGRRLLLAAAILALAATGRTQAGGAPALDPAEVRSVRHVLDPRLRRDRAAAAIVKELAGLGPRAAPVFIAMLTGALPATDWEESGLSLEEARACEGGEAALLVEALRALPSAAVARSLTEACAGDSPLDQRLVGLHLVAEVGEGAPAVACWREIGKGIEEIHLRRAYVRAQLESALARCLERSAAAFEPFARGLRDWDAKLYPAIMHACTQANRRQGVEVLAALRGNGRELDLELLDNLSLLAAATRGGLSELELSWVRGFLGDPDPGVRTRALLALGRVCDPASASALVDALGDADEGVAQAALWSLRHVSGLSLGGEAEGWRSWMRAEGRWGDAERARCFQALDSKDPAPAVEALSELARHPLYRHESAAAISGSCERAEPAVQRAACAALQQLDSMVAADALAGLLAAEDEDVRAAAHRALVAISGQKLAPQPELWQAFLGI